MLAVEPSNRLLAQECLDHPVVTGVMREPLPEEVFEDGRGRMEDHTNELLHKGTMWKLNVHSDPMDFTQWLERDMWLTPNGHLCYFSQKEYKRLVLLDANMLHRAVVTDFSGGCRGNAFQLEIKAQCQDEPNHVHVFACNSDLERAAKDVLLHVAGGDIQARISAGTLAVNAVLHLKLHVNNKRKPIDHSAGCHFELYFKAWLWKLRAAGDPRNESHWFQRHTWLSKNGSLVYWSEKEDANSFAAPLPRSLVSACVK